MTKKAAAFERSGKVFLHPYSRTVQEFWVFSSPVTVTNWSDEELGNALLATLDQSRAGVPHPSSWEGLTAPLLRAAAVKSFGTFVTGASAVEVLSENEVIKLVPTRNGGKGNAFQHLTAKAIRSGSEPQELKRMLRRAFDLCE